MWNTGQNFQCVHTTFVVNILCDLTHITHTNAKLRPLKVTWCNVPFTYLLPIYCTYLYVTQHTGRISCQKFALAWSILYLWYPHHRQCNLKKVLGRHFRSFLYSFCVIWREVRSRLSAILNEINKIRQNVALLKCMKNIHQHPVFVWLNHQEDHNGEFLRCGGW